ncbi:MAG: hypothetical protein ACE5HL_10345 [Terriglobia bacterium]
MYDLGEQVRRLARAVVGRPPPERILTPKRKKRSKHKKQELERALEE